METIHRKNTEVGKKLISLSILILLLAGFNCGGRKSDDPQSGSDNEIRGLFVCQNPEKYIGLPPNLEFKSADIVMASYNDPPVSVPVQYKREGNFIYFIFPGVTNGISVEFLTLYLTSVKIVSSSSLEEDNPGEPGNPYVWLKGQ